MIFNQDFKCPYCGKKINAVKLESYIEEAYSKGYSGDEVEAEVTCEYCKEEFEIYAEVEFSIDFNITKISKI
ncbi:hypothetical protein [Campylobacter ureolyticus]|uniref:hypothetical protein n=1 Tax=Campylobacter ureolyticus TaxID=827 RepID=UPI00288A145D|nr:hypothetical protein [Campylobacter ureolyticus]